MIHQESKKLIDEFMKTTNAEGVLVTDINGQMLYTTESKLENSELEELSALLSVSDSMYSKINEKLKTDQKELTVIVNKTDYILIKKVEDAFVLLSQIKRTEDINMIYNEVEKFISVFLSKGIL
ncbi:MAG: roadblock/LC7 domain-containing protein [Chitinophagales bacterium]